MTKETLDKKAKIVENFYEKVKHFIFPSRESLNSDCSSQVFWVELFFCNCGFYSKQRQEGANTHFWAWTERGYESPYRVTANNRACGKHFLFPEWRTDGPWRTDPSEHCLILCSYTVPLALQHLKILQWKCVRVTPFCLALGLVHNISAGRNKCGALFNFTFCSVSWSQQTLIFERHLCLPVLRKLLSLLIPEWKEFLKYKILIRKIFIFPCLLRKCISLQLYPCCKH